MSESVFCTSAELAAHLRVSDKTITKRAREGLLPPSVRIGKQYLWAWDDIRLWHQWGECAENIFRIRKSNREKKPEQVRKEEAA